MHPSDAVGDAGRFPPGDAADAAPTSSFGGGAVRAPRAARMFVAMSRIPFDVGSRAAGWGFAIGSGSSTSSVAGSGGTAAGFVAGPGLAV